MGEKLCVRLTSEEVDAFVALGWTLHSGPYNSAEECLANCTDSSGGTVQITCEEEVANVSRRLLVTFSNVTGPCAESFPTETIVEFDEVANGWVSCFAVSNDCYFKLNIGYCTSGNIMHFSIGSNETIATSLSPFSMVKSAYNQWVGLEIDCETVTGCCNETAADLTFSEVP